MTFFKIHSQYLVDNFNDVDDTYLALNVVQGDVSVTPDTNIVSTELNRGVNGNILYKHFLNKGDGGITVKINVAIHKDETYNDFLVTDVINSILLAGAVVNIVTDAIDVPNGQYIILKNPSRKQSHANYTTWELEFMTYHGITSVVYKNDNTRVKTALANAKKAKDKAKAKTAKKTVKKTTKNSTSYVTKFKKCKYTTLKYTKKKKVVTCVKYLQKILAKKKHYTGAVDGWYGSMTVTAVKKFQKKQKLKQTGKINKTTFEYLAYGMPLATKKKLNKVTTSAKKK